MTVIRMNTDDVHTAAYQVDWAAGELYLKPSRLRSAASSLTSVWEGGKASHYAAELRRLANQLHDDVINLQRLASRLRSELAEWEGAAAQLDGESALGNRPWWMTLPGEGLEDPNKYLGILPLLPIIMGPIAGVPMTLPGVMTGPQGTTPWLEDHGRWSEDFGYDDHILELDGKNWKDTKPSLGVGLKAGVGDEAVDGGYYKLSKWDVGGKVGVGEKGFTAGVYGEYDLAEVEATGVIGSSMFGFTATGGATAGSVDAFAGIKDNDLGASIGASAFGGEVGLGVNIAGFNLRLVGGLSAGMELGFKVGDDTSVKLGPFKVGLSFGKALEPTFGNGASQ